METLLTRLAADGSRKSGPKLLPPRRSKIVQLTDKCHALVLSTASSQRLFGTRPVLCYRIQWPEDGMRIRFFVGVPFHDSGSCGAYRTSAAYKTSTGLFQLPHGKFLGTTTLANRRRRKACQKWISILVR